MIRLYVLPTDAEPYIHTLDPDQNPLKSLQDLVGGYIESVTVQRRVFDSIIPNHDLSLHFIINEEGGMLQLPDNPHIPYFVGTIIMALIDADGEIADLKPEWASLLLIAASRSIA